MTHSFPNVHLLPQTHTHPTTTHTIPYHTHTIPHTHTTHTLTTRGWVSISSLWTWVWVSQGIHKYNHYQWPTQWKNAFSELEPQHVFFTSSVQPWLPLESLEGLVKIRMLRPQPTPLNQSSRGWGPVSFHCIKPPGDSDVQALVRIGALCSTLQPCRGLSLSSSITAVCVSGTDMGLTSHRPAKMQTHFDETYICGRNHTFLSQIL